MTMRIRFLLVYVWILASAAGVLIGCSPQTTSSRRTDSVSGPAGKIHVDDGGEGGLPVLFVHSYAGNTTHWASQLAHLRSSRRAIAMDLRGHGQSAAPASGDYEVTSLADDIAAVVRALDLERFVLVGHSMGGAASLAYAGAHPDQVAGLVLVGTPGKSPPEMATQVMSSLENDYEKTMEAFWSDLLAKAQPDVAAQLQRERLDVPREASLKIIRAIFEFDPSPALNAYRGPMLIIDEEQEDFPGALHHLAPDAPHKVIMGASHWVQMDKPEEFNEILDKFLDTVD